MIGVGAAESASVIDGVLTLGILWLDYCRQHADARRHFGGLKVDCSGGRLAHHGRAHGLAEPRRREFRVVHSRRAQRRTRARRLSRHRQPGLAPGARLFARRRARALPGPASTAFSRSFPTPRASASRSVPTPPLKSACFCTVSNSPACVTALRRTPSRARTKSPSARAPSETPLTQENEDLCRDLLRRLFLSRHADGAHTDPLFRMAPERWLESRLRTALAGAASRVCAAICSTPRFPRSPPATAACSTCSRSTATRAWWFWS